MRSSQTIYQAEMYKIALQPNPSNSIVIIKVLKKVSFFNLTYWKTVERVLCSSEHFEFQKERVLSKYNTTADTTSLQKSEMVLAHISGFVIQ